MIMKGMLVRFKSGSGDYRNGTVASEPYPKISPQQLHVMGNGGTYVGAASTTCVIVMSKGVMHEDIPVSDITVDSQRIIDRVLNKCRS